MTTKHFLNNRFEIFLMAFCLLFLEALYFKTALFIQDYLNALFLVSYALTGLAIGALLSNHHQSLSQIAITRIKLVMIGSIFFSVLNFVLFYNVLFLSPLIIIPFASGNIIISYYLKQENAHGIYFIDLFGATLGVLSVVFFIPLIREENCFILVVCILFLSLCLNQSGKKEKLAVTIIAVIFSFGFLACNLEYDTVNFFKITRPQTQGPKDKIYSRSKEFKLLYSKGSNVQRIDVLSPSYSMFNEVAWPSMIYVAFNGLVNDVVRSEDFDRFAYRYDPRVIYGLVEKPDFLVIGTSAEGVVKTGAAHGGAVTGLEINPQIIELMQGPLLAYSKNAYSLMDALYEMDARTYFLQNSKKFDIITLMNSHMGRHSGLIGTPEFLHTRQAIESYMDHLTEKGFVVFEEKYYGAHGRLSSIKIIHTILDVLRSNGIQNPKDHLYVYHWILNGLSILGDPEQPMVSHVMIVVKKQPFQNRDRFIIGRWANQVERYYGRSHEIIGIYPDNELPSLFTSQVHDFISNYGDLKKAKPKEEKSSDDFSIITDDKPFPWSVDAHHRLIKSYVYKIGSVSLALLFGMLMYLRKIEKQWPRPGFFLYALYFALIGLGYFILEIGLMNFYQIFMGSPTYAFVFILGTLLLSSGLGSYFSGRFKTNKSIWVFIGIFLMASYHLFFGRQIISMTGAGSLHNSILIAFTVFPLGFLMGIPFPSGIETIKGKFIQNYTAVFFAINCIFSSFAVIFSFYLSIAYGFKITFGIGFFSYLSALVIFNLMQKSTWLIRH